LRTKILIMIVFIRTYI